MKSTALVGYHTIVISIGRKLWRSCWVWYCRVIIILMWYLHMFMKLTLKWSFTCCYILGFSTSIIYIAIYLVVHCVRNCRSNILILLAWHSFGLCDICFMYHWLVCFIKPRILHTPRLTGHVTMMLYIQMLTTNGIARVLPVPRLVTDICIWILYYPWPTFSGVILLPFLVIPTWFSPIPPPKSIGLIIYIWFSRDCWNRFWHTIHSQRLNRFRCTLLD